MPCAIESYHMLNHKFVVIRPKLLTVPWSCTPAYATTNNKSSFCSTFFPLHKAIVLTLLEATSCLWGILFSAVQTKQQRMYQLYYHQVQDTKLLLPLEGTIFRISFQTISRRIKQQNTEWAAKTSVEYGTTRICGSQVVSYLWNSKIGKGVTAMIWSVCADIMAGAVREKGVLSASPHVQNK